jgi:hypothetical protein
MQQVDELIWCIALIGKCFRLLCIHEEDSIAKRAVSSCTEELRVASSSRLHRMRKMTMEKRPRAV